MARLSLTTTTLSSPQPRRLADFYQQLLGWQRGSDEEGWVTIGSSDGGHRLGFHVDEAYQPPVWPSRDGEPVMQVHLEIATDDLAGAVARATDYGATEAAVQPQDDVRVMLDPDGHPFCLFLWPDMP
jgi:predicted enzyme related to lactoylglutathione lyase